MLIRSCLADGVVECFYILPGFLFVLSIVERRVLKTLLLWIFLFLLSVLSGALIISQQK